MKHLLTNSIWQAVALSLTIWGSPASGANIVVTSLGDSGPGTLRDAIAAAVPGDTITFAVTGAIALAGSQLVVDKRLTIMGPGSDLLAISGSAMSRVMEVTETGDLSLSGITIRDGRSTEGGGIRNFGAVSLEGVVVTKSAIGLSGGGGLVNLHRMSISKSTISENEANPGSGGGIVNATDGLLILRDSTVSGNRATTGSGGILNQGMLDATNVTVTGNTAENSSGGIGNAGTLSMTHGTITRNSSSGVGGGLTTFNGNTSELTATIVAGNLVGGDCATLGTVVSLGNNLDGDGTCGLGDPSDLSSTNPLLEPLGDNGGPTLTHALQSNSPAADHVAQNDCVLATDQRGFARPAGAGCDIGAFELSKGCPLTTAALIDGDARASLTLAYGVRDRVLPRLAQGRWMIAAYYRHGDEVGRRLLTDRQLRRQALSLFDQFRPALEAAIAGGELTLDIDDRLELERFAEALQRGASRDLADDLEVFLEML